MQVLKRSVVQNKQAMMLSIPAGLLTCYDLNYDISAL